MKHIHFDDVVKATDQELRQILEALLLHFKIHVIIDKNLAEIYPEL